MPPYLTPTPIPTNGGECPLKWQWVTPSLKNVLSSLKDQGKVFIESIRMSQRWYLYSLWWLYLLWWRNQKFMKFGLEVKFDIFNVKDNLPTKLQGS